MKRHSWLLAYTTTLVVGCISSQQGSRKANTNPITPSETMRTNTMNDNGYSASNSESDYKAQCHNELDTAEQLIRQLESPRHQPPTIANTLVVLNDLDVVIDRAMNQAALLRNVHPNADIRDAADRCEQEFSKLQTRLSLSRPVYDAVSALDVSEADALTQRFVAHVLRDFRRAGVDKDESTRDKIRTLNEELVQISQQFDRNIREDVRRLYLNSIEELEGLPADYIESHSPNTDGHIVITTDYPDVIPFMQYAKSDAQRLSLYKLFRQRGNPSNSTVLGDLLRKRWELAQLLGYKTWADYVTEDKMIRTSAAAGEFIDKVAELSKASAERDYGIMLERLRQDDPGATAVGDWQKAYLEELVKRERYAFDSQAVRAYFPYERVRRGLFEITSKLFGVHYRAVPDWPRWDPGVEAFEMLDSTGEVIGRFFLDMHPRPDKYKHAAAFPIRSGLAGRQVPEAALVCNFPGGQGDDGLMEHRQVETFFHEFGHLLHHLFAGTQTWVRFSGIATEWDFVEAPSQMLEEWAWDLESLRTFAINAKGEPIPKRLVDAMRRARDFGKGLAVSHQMFYAAVSLNYYNRDPRGLDTTATMRQLQDCYSYFKYVDDTYFQYSFGHLDGYSAIYYTYMWSLVIAKDLFSVFGDSGLLDPRAAGRYRRHVLAPGGSRDASDLVRDFLGRNHSFESFAQWLDGRQPE